MNLLHNTYFYYIHTNILAIVMTKTRREKLIEELENALEQNERDLIETPAGMTQEKYFELIEIVKNTRATLEIVKKM